MPAWKPFGSITKNDKAGNWFLTCYKIITLMMPALTFAGHVPQPTCLKDVFVLINSTVAPANIWVWYNCVLPLIYRIKKNIEITNARNLILSFMYFTLQKRWNIANAQYSLLLNLTLKLSSAAQPKLESQWRDMEWTEEWVKLWTSIESRL